MRSLKLLVLFAMVAAMALPVNAADISLSKGVTPAAPNVYHQGETIHYVMTVTNTHPTETITINTVVDTLPDGSTVNLTPPAVPYDLAAGASQGYTLDWPVPGDAVGGIVVNTLRVTGVQHSTIDDPFDAQVQKSSLIVVPCVDVTKTVLPTTSKAGDDVTYTITVCNCSDVNIVPVSVIDSILGDLSSSYVNQLAPRQCEQHQFPYTIDPCDPDPLINEVTANYEDTFGFAVSDDANAVVDLVHPCLGVTKSCLNEPVPPGGSAIFRVTITNCGDIALNVSTTEPAIPPFTLAADSNYQQDIAIEANDIDVFNSITARATLPQELGLDNVIGPVEANDTCRVEQEGATRTLGFWKTHCEYTEHIFCTHCGGAINLGWVNLTCINDVLGILFANPAKDASGAKRSALCQARVIASKQAVAALLNNCLDNGATLPVTPAEIATILGGTNKTAIKQLGALLDTYNNSGDDVAIIDNDGFLFGNATPKDCAASANLGAANCRPVLSTRCSCPD